MKHAQSKLTEPTFELELRGVRPVAWLDDPPLSRMQALVLRTLQNLGTEAYGLKVVQTLSHAAGVLVDHSQIYSIIRKLDKKELVKIREVREQVGKRPALKIYKLTALGLAALEATTEHHRAVVAFLSEAKSQP